MAKFIGEAVVDIKSTPFRNYTVNDWAMYFIERYGQFDGSHHKQWVLDQVARILMGTKIKIKFAEWTDGTTEYRVTLMKPTKKYLKWVEEMKGMGEDGKYVYGYDEGIAP